MSHVAHDFMPKQTHCSLSNSYIGIFEELIEFHLLFRVHYFLLVLTLLEELYGLI